jgi:hypothetical protein
VGRTNNNWLNPAAFAMPAPGTWGNLGRYAARDPGFFELDLALQKKFLLTERIGLNFRAEMFNIFNEAIYANSSASLDSNPLSASASFGRIYIASKYRCHGHRYTARIPVRCSSQLVDQTHISYDSMNDRPPHSGTVSIA